MGRQAEMTLAQSLQCGRLCFKKLALFCPTAVLGIERKAVSNPVQPGAIFERDGKRREVVRLIPARLFTSPAVEWRRPGQDMRSSACSVAAWFKWAKEARQIP